MTEPAYKVEPPQGGYHVEKREVVAQVPDLRMVILTLAPGHEVPWHFHTHVTDTFFCMEGPMVVATRSPDAQVELQAGQTYAVPAQRPHRVTGKDMGRCRFALLQGVGTYDFKPLR
jgi:quercetin dioxygenase-like cupin family protein